MTATPVDDHPEGAGAFDLASALTQAVAQHQAGRLDEAEVLYRQILARNTHHFDSLHLLGVIYYQRGRHGEALRLIDAALEVNPASPAAHTHRANALMDLGRTTEALEGYDRASALDPGHVDAHYGRGNLLRELGRFEQALASYDRALAVNPNHVLTLNNRANTLKRLNRFEDALASYDRALAVRPDYLDALHNRGTCLMDLRRFDDAVASFDRAIAARRDYSHAILARGLCRLLQGRFDDGWVDYEARWRIPNTLELRNFAQPQWMGDTSVAGKTLLVHAEQGLGDTLMAVRFVPRLAALGASVVLEVQRELLPLIAQIGGTSAMVAKGDSLPDFDLHCPIMSLPRVLRTTLETIPADVPYLRARPADVSAWRDRLPASPAPRIGLVWSGNPRNQNDARRSIRLADLVRSLPPTGAKFFSLQKELRPGDAEMLRANPDIVDLGSQLDTFADTAAVMSHLDLVVSVDTSVAHLAGAMGRPLWLLLQFTPEWRWLLDRDDSPWYPTARLFRQSKSDDWAEVLDRIAGEIGRLVHDRRGAAPAPGSRR